MFLLAIAVCIAWSGGFEGTCSARSRAQSSPLLAQLTISLGRDHSCVGLSVPPSHRTKVSVYIIYIQVHFPFDLRNIGIGMPYQDICALKPVRSVEKNTSRSKTSVLLFAHERKGIYAGRDVSWVLKVAHQLSSSTSATVRYDVYC